MNYSRLAIAALGATVAYFILGTIFFALSPLKEEFRKYPAVYRTAENMKAVMPFGVLGMLLSIFALVVLYSLLYRSDFGLTQGIRFGALVGAFSVGSFVLHNYVNLNIGLRLTLAQAIAYFIQWTLVGLVIGWLYRPVPS